MYYLLEIIHLRPKINNIHNVQAHRVFKVMFTWTLGLFWSQIVECNWSRWWNLRVWKPVTNYCIWKPFCFMIKGPRIKVCVCLCVCACVSVCLCVLVCVHVCLCNRRRSLSSCCQAPPPRTVFPGIPLMIAQGIPGKTGPRGQGKTLTLGEAGSERSQTWKTN